MGPSLPQWCVTKAPLQGHRAFVIAVLISPRRGTSAAMTVADSFGTALALAVTGVLFAALAAGGYAFVALFALAALLAAARERGVLVVVDGGTWVGALAITALVGVVVVAVALAVSLRLRVEEVSELLAPLTRRLRRG